MGLELLDARTTAAVSEVARRRGLCASQGNPLGWFDGFWDFVTTERVRLERSVAWRVSDGGPHTPDWILMYWRAAANEDAQLDIFVECRDYRPGARAPWPVTTIYLHNSELVPPSALPPRSCDAGIIAELAALAFKIQFGYWGVHAVCTALNGIDAEVLDQALSLCLAVVAAYYSGSAVSPRPVPSR